MARSARQAELAKIHIGAKQLGLDRDTYERMLHTVARVTSAADLDHAGRRKVLDHMRSCGAKFHSPRQGHRYKRGSQAALMRFLWDKLHEAGAVRDRSDLALRRYVKHQTEPYHPDQAGYDAPELVPAAIASKVIEQMKLWCRRSGVEIA